MKSECNFYSSINYEVQEYRKSFLKRKNVSNYKKSKKNTPVVIDKLFNSFDRKIKGISIFTDEVKKEYFKGLKCIFESYYNETFEPKNSRRYAYTNYLAENYIIFGKNYKSKTYKEFIKSGLANKYK
jgi:hypothetical protein